MNFIDCTMSYLTFVCRETTSVESAPISQSGPFKLFRSKPQFAPLRPIRHWLESIKIQDPKWAHRICQLIPAQCPFERDIKVFGRVLFHIPPLCKLNPFYLSVVRGLPPSAQAWRRDESRQNKNMSGNEYDNVRRSQGKVVSKQRTASSFSKKLRLLQICLELLPREN